jgi:hypothetical protein
MGVDVECPEVKSIDQIGVSDNTRNNFETPCLGRSGTDFDGV